MGSNGECWVRGEDHISRGCPACGAPFESAVGDQIQSAAVDRIVAGSAVDDIGPQTARQCIGSPTAQDHVRTAAAVDDVVAITTGSQITTSAGINRVVANATGVTIRKRCSRVGIVARGPFGISTRRASGLLADQDVVDTPGFVDPILIQSRTKPKL